MTKKKTAVIAYSALMAVTAALVISLCAWAAAGSGLQSAVNYIDGEVLLDGVRSEYLVGETVAADGVTLKAGGKTFSGGKIEISVDNLSAGDKMVEVTHREGGDCYRGYFPVRYFLIRHLDMRKTPTRVVTDADGKVSVEGMVLWAELSGVPTAFKQPDEEGYDTVIILGEDNYDIKLGERDEYGGFTAQISCGSATASTYLIDVGGEYVALDSPNRIMTFANESGTDSTLTLYVTSYGATDGDRLNVAEGFYVYRGGGETRRLKFGYYLMNGTWASVFHSADFGEGLREERREAEGDSLVVFFNGESFRGSSEDWRRAILNG